MRSSSSVYGTASWRRRGARFPPDLAALLHHALPIGGQFPDWRGLPDGLDDQLGWPLEGMHFDIEHNTFWPDGWGPRPPSVDDAKAIATEHVAAAPRLIPITGHRYISAEPHADGNPVFSVYQTDIIYYGNDLPSYLASEWKFPCPTWARTTTRWIRFWSWLCVLDGDCGEHDDAP